MNNIIKTILTITITLFLTASSHAQFGIQASLGSGNLIFSPINAGGESFTAFGLGGVYRASQNFQTGLNLQFGSNLSSLSIKIPLLGKFYLGDKFHFIAGLTPEILTGMDEVYESLGYKSFSANFTTGLGFDFNTDNKSGLQLTYDYGVNNIYEADSGLLGDFTGRLIGVAISYNYMF